MTDNVTNYHRVPKKQWAKWTETGRMTFNVVYGHMMTEAWAYRHPKAEAVPPAHWSTTAWNAAWIAADAASGLMADDEHVSVVEVAA